MTFREAVKNIHDRMVDIIEKESPLVVSARLTINASCFGEYDTILMFNTTNYPDGEFETRAYTCGVSEAGFLEPRDPREVLKWFDEITSNGICTDIKYLDY